MYNERAVMSESQINRIKIAPLRSQCLNQELSVFAVSINPSLTPQSFTSDSEEVWRLRTRKYFNVQNFLKSWHPNVRIENKNLRKMSSIIVTCNKKPVECFIIHYLLSIKSCKERWQSISSPLTVSPPPPRPPDHWTCRSWSAATRQSGPAGACIAGLGNKKIENRYF